MDTTPDANDLWSGIGGHFDTFTQILCEFIDNSISNYDAIESRIRSINVRISELPDERINVQIEDAGSGFQDLEAAFKLGNKTCRQTPLNEHGFGFKHALASANPENDDWRVYTRTKDDFQNQTYNKITSEYRFNQVVHSINISSEPWPGQFNGSGTIFDFSCNKILFDTLQRGIPGRARFERLFDYLLEDLGYIYSGVIESGKVTITIDTPSGRKVVSAIVPQWVGYYDPRPNKVPLDLGGGTLEVEFKFGEVATHPTAMKYYKRNMATSGAEIRINGRVIMSNLFTEIWNIEAHPQYNHFLAIINIFSNNRDALPKTRTSKNSLRIDDDKLQKLYEWIRSTHPDPESKLSGAINEMALVRELEQLKNAHIRSPSKQVRRGFKVFNRIGSNVFVDLYVFDGNDIVLYEAKKDIADVQDLYQLLMYWDGAVYDGIIPTEGILIATTVTPGVVAVINRLNQLTDSNGNNYNLSIKTWMSEGVSYP